MIRALIGRFVLLCIKKSKDRRFDRQWSGVDMAALSDRQISDMIHGRAVDLTRLARLPARRIRS